MSAPIRRVGWLQAVGASVGGQLAALPVLGAAWLIVSSAPHHAYLSLLVAAGVVLGGTGAAYAAASVARALIRRWTTMTVGTRTAWADFGLSALLVGAAMSFSASLALVIAFLAPAIWLREDATPQPTRLRTPSPVHGRPTR